MQTIDLHVHVGIHVHIIIHVYMIYNYTQIAWQMANLGHHVCSNCHAELTLA